MIDVSAWISAGAAVISVAMAGVTIWWPWHTRSLPSFTQRRITLRHADERLVPLIVACGFRRPFLFVEWRNDGDGPAHAVKVTSDSACDIRLMVEGPQFEHGYDLVDDVALLNPGESFVAIILPTSGTDLESVDAVLEYREEPTRLDRFLVSTRFPLPYRLPALRPLDIRERRAAWEYLRETCERLGYGTTDAEVRYFVSRVLLEDYRAVDPTCVDNPRSG